MAIAITRFAGIKPRIDPQNLDASSAQASVNAWLHNGSLQPFKASTFVVTPTKAGTKKTIYRFGQTGADESLYWFTWVDDVDCVKGQIAGDTDERTYFSGDSAYGHPRVTKASIALIGGTDYPMQSYRLGVIAPSAAPAGVVSGTGSGTNSNRAYVYTNVTGDGEESQPSPVLSIVVQDGQTVTLSSFTAAPAGYNIASRRFYRTVVGNTTSTDYQFITELPIATTSYADSILDKNLGATIPSIDWATPIASLKGLKNMANGIMAGFDGYDVWMCVPYRPFAWPVSNRQSVDWPVVGLGAISDTLVVCTAGKPYRLIGTDPEQMAPVRIELEEACVSKRSIVETRMGVMYASPNGLVLIGPSGASLVTDSIIDKDFWKTLNPSSILGAENMGRYHGYYDTGTVQGGFIFDPNNAAQPFTMTDVFTTAAYNDVVRDALFYVSGTSIRKWEGATGSFLTYRWRSKDFSTHTKSFGIAMVQANAYPVTLRLYADIKQADLSVVRTLMHVQTVANERSFRLPSGYTSNTWAVELEGSNRVTAAYVAQNSEELKRLLDGTDGA